MRPLRRFVRAYHDKEIGSSELLPKSESPSVKDSFMRFRRIIGHSRSGESRYLILLFVVHTYISGSAYNEYVPWIRRNTEKDSRINNPQNFTLSSFRLFVFCRE